MTSAILRHKWMLVALAVFAAGSLPWPQLAWAPTAVEYIFDPVGLATAQTARVAVHNSTGEDALVVIAIKDAITGAILLKTEATIVGPGKGTTVDLPAVQLPAVQLPAVQRTEIIAILNVSSFSGAAINFRKLPFAISLQVVDDETGKTTAVGHCCGASIEPGSH